MSKIVLAEQASAPDTPASGNLTVYAASQTLKWKDSAGAISTVAGLATAQTFTAAQKFGTGAGTAQVAIKSQAAGTVALLVDTAASQINATQLWQYNGTSRANIYTTASATVLTLSAFDNGSAEGPHVRIERNSNASTPAAGHIKMHNLSGTFYYLWVDATGDLRIGTTAPTNANDIGGTVVGTQS